jgi:hypothetical protein
MLKKTLIAIFLIASFTHICWATAFFNTVKRNFKPSDTLILAKLADSSGSVLDEVKIEVRGAGLKAASRAPSR